MLPVIDGQTGKPAFFQLAGLSVGSGAYQAFLDTSYLTADVNYRENLICGDDIRLDALIGYRYAHLHEGLHLYNKRMSADDFLIRTKDHISDSNQFHGGQFGLSGEYRIDRWYLDFTGKVVLGEVFTSTEEQGAFRVNTVVDPFGFYSRPAVSGDRSSSRFAVMPAANLTFGRQVFEHGRVFVGYSFQYLSSVIRPADILDPIPTLNGPGFGMRREATTSDFWAQSVNLGLELRY